jgi:hypothetical protein
LGGALSEATAAALRVHVLAQLTAALAEEEEGIGEDDDEADEADWVDREDADNGGDGDGDSAVQAMLDAFLADGGSFEDADGGEDGVGDGAASGVRSGARTDRFSSVLAPRGEAEEARWDLRLELTPPVRSTRAQPTTTRPGAPPSHPRPNPAFSPGARGPARAHARSGGRRPRGERGRRRAPLRAGRARLGTWRAGAANARGHALVRGWLPILRVRRAAARKARDERDEPGSLTNVLSLTDYPTYSYSLTHLL